MTTPTMTFGVKTTEDTEQGGSGGYIRRFNKDGEYRLRFLQEFEDWTVYYEHFSASKKTSYPCTGDRKTCPGCTNPDKDEARAAKRYLVNALQRDPNSDKEGYVNLWKLPAPSLKEPLERYSKKSGDTLVDRDYTVYRSTNETGQTRYTMDREEREPMDLTKYELADHQSALMQEFMEAWDPAASAAKQERINDSKKAKDEPKQKEFKLAAAEPEVPDALLSKEEKAAKATKPKLAKQPDPEPEPEEEVELTPSAIKEMSVPQLTKLFADAGFDIPEGVSKDDANDLALALIRLLSE